MWQVLKPHAEIKADIHKSAIGDTAFVSLPNEETSYKKDGICLCFLSLSFGQSRLCIVSHPCCSPAASCQTLIDTEEPG